MTADFSTGLLLDVAAVLETHGYARLDGPGFVELAVALAQFPRSAVVAGAAEPWSATGFGGVDEAGGATASSPRRGTPPAYLTP